MKKKKIPFIISNRYKQFSHTIPFFLLISFLLFEKSNHDSIIYYLFDSMFVFLYNYIVQT